MLGTHSTPISLDTWIGLSFLVIPFDYVACGNFFGIAGSTVWEIIEEFVVIIFELENLFISLSSLQDNPALVHGMLTIY